MARWDYRYFGFERFPGALSALEIRTAARVDEPAGGGLADWLREDDRDAVEFGAAEGIASVVI